MKRQRSTFALIAICLMLLSLIPATAWVQLAAAQVEVGPTLDPLTIPKFVTQLPIPPVWEPTVVRDAGGNVVSHNYTIEAVRFTQQVLPTGFPATTVWGYSGPSLDRITGAPLGVFQHTPASSFEAVRGIPVYVKWVNNINGSHLFAVDPTLMWANPNDFMPQAPYQPYPPGYPEAQSPVPIVTHLHGGESKSASDGGPLQWYTSTGIHGADYATEKPTEPNAAVYYYDNAQPPGTLWYHDHAVGITRINVLSGLAGYYFLRDPADQVAPLLPTGVYEVPIAIQDRSFNVDGSFWFPTVGINPDIHPYWFPEFFGNTIMVNGAVWPNLNVDRGQYRFRVLDGSNARFYHLWFSNNMTFTVIGSDGSYLRKPAVVSDLVIAPGERYDILVDFASIQPGTKVLLLNDAKAPFPDGDEINRGTVGEIMQFTVTASAGFAARQLPEYLNPTLPAAQQFPTLTADAPLRTLTVNEIMGVMLLLGLTIPVPVGSQQVPASSVLPEVEAGQFQGILLTRLADQRNNAIEGTQIIDRDAYRLAVTGLVGRPLNLTYGDLLALPAYSEVVYMPCVEGWGFTAKWTGFRINDLLRMAELSPDATYVLFRSADGYSTGLPLSYLTDRDTLMAYGINDVTLPPDRGFPLQVVAADKYGYKWAKWVTSIEVGDAEVEGFWESRGYSNSGDVGGFPFG